VSTPILSINDVPSWLKKAESMPKKQASFAPRVINPVKITDALILSAAEELSKAAKTLKMDLPRVNTHVLSGPLEAVHFRTEGAAVLLCDDTALNLLDTDALKKHNPNLVVALLSAMEAIHCSPPAVSSEKYPYILKADLVFAINRSHCAPPRIVTSVVRNAEDLLNIERYSKAQRYIILVVDDEPRWTSQFLPVLYDIIGQRAAVKVTRTYEETLSFLFGVDKEKRIKKEDYRRHGHGDDVVCLITDIFYPRDDNLRKDAGTDLIHLIDTYYPRFPKIIASKASEADDLKSTAFLMPKGDPGSLDTLRDYLQDHTGMGDFLVRSKTGKVLYRIRNIREMLKVLKLADRPTKTGEKLRGILESHGERDNFSTWLYMHGHKDLADQLLPRRAKGHRLIDLLRRVFEEEIARVDATPLLISDLEIFTLEDLLAAMRSLPPAKIQEHSDNDVFSNWLDLKGYSELAEEIRPIHGTGQRLEKSLIEKIERWVKIYAPIQKGDGNGKSEGQDL
jgi:hypothetical protein